MIKQTILLHWGVLLLMLLESCNNSSGSDGDLTTPGQPLEWLIPKEKVLDGGPGKDGIPAIDEPIFTTNAGELGYLKPNDYVLLWRQGDEVRAYPHPILDWHEIVNDAMDTAAVAITYCPLTGTGIGWRRRLGSTLTTFGVSGLLYNSNLLPYDRASNSTWSQMGLQCVNGERIGQAARTVTLVETTVATWQQSYPGSKLLAGGRGRTRPYGTYPYGDFRENQQRLLFPVDHSDDNRFPKKERLLGIMQGGDIVVVPFGSFPATGTGIVRKVVGGEKVVVVGNRSQQFMAAFLEEGRTFEPATEPLPAVLRDGQGNEYDLLGRTIRGPERGRQLQAPPAMMGYWFAWAAFYPDLQL